MKSVLTKIPRPKQSKSDPLKVQLAAAYRILAMLKLDDLTYAHLSARHPDGDSYFIYPFGFGPGRILSKNGSIPLSFAGYLDHFICGFHWAGAVYHPAYDPAD